jgi:hypothetical protein
MRTQRLRTKRLQFMLTREEVNLLDDFRFQWRIPSRAAAVRELISRGEETKLANILFTIELARRLDGTAVTALTPSAP